MECLRLSKTGFGVFDDALFDKIEKKIQKISPGGLFLGHCERIKKSFSEGEMSSSVTG